MRNLSIKFFSYFRKASSSPLAFFAFAYGGAAALRKGAGFVLFLWLAHSLSVQAYASFGLLFALQSALSALAAAGILESVIGSLTSHADTQSRVRLFHSANTVLFFLVGISSAVVAIIYLFITSREERSMTDFVFATVGGVLTAFYTLQSSLVRLDEKHTASLILSFVAPSAGLLGGAVGFWHSATVTAFFTGSAVGLIGIFPVLYFLKIGTYGLIKKWDDARHILDQIFPYILIVLLGWLGGYGNTYLIKYFFYSDEVARFTFIYTLASILELVATSLNQVWNPRFFILLREVSLDEVEKKNRRFFLLEGFALGLVGALLIIGVPPVLHRMGGHLAAYANIRNELALLFGGYAISIPWWHAQNYYYALSRGKELMFVIVLCSIVGLLLWLFAMKIFGPLGIYIGFLMQMATRMGGAVIWARRRWAIGFAWTGSVAAFALLAVGVVIGVFFH